MEDVVSRTMYCKYCNAHDRPKKGSMFVVWGHNRQLLLVKQSHNDGLSGFTPHLIIFNVNPTVKNGMVSVVKVCGIHGCGVEVGAVRKDGSYDITFLRKERTEIPLADFNSLVATWKSTGYELL